jgi:hypothetical protein
VVLTDLRATAGSVVAGMAATENTVPETQRMPDKLGDVLFATPSFLPPEALRALVARGVVGTARCVLDA